MELFIVIMLLCTISPGLSELEVPSFQVEPPLKVEFSNSTGGVVPCTCSGRPRPKVTWRTATGELVKDIEGLRRVRVDGSLYFLPFSHEKYKVDVHSTVYRCIAENAVGSVVSRDVFVRAVVPRLREIRLSDEFLSKGNTAVLRCPHDSDDIFVRFWERADGFRINENAEGGKYGLLENGDLYILDANERDNKDSFTCYTENRITKEQKISLNSAKVIVSEPLTDRPPRVVHSSRKVNVVANQKAIVSCVAHGHPIPIYKWTKVNGQRLAALDFGVRVRQEGGILRFHRALTSDTGKYTCYVSNGIGEDRVDVEIVVREPLSVVLSPPLLEANIGDSVELRCSISSGGTPEAKVTWLKNSETLLPDNNHVVILAPTILKLVRVDRKDEGMYQCFARLDSESAQAASRLLIKDIPAKLRSTFTEKTVSAGSFVSMTCSTTGSPRPAIQWTLDNIWRLSSRPGHSITTAVGDSGEVVSTLNISSADVPDSGLYSCSATNDAGTDIHGRRLNVFGPLFVREVNRNVTTLSGRNMTLICPFGGFPYDAVTWKKDGEPLPVHSRQNVLSNGALVVEHVDQEQDDGIYNCQVSARPGLPPAFGSLMVVVRTAPVVAPFDFRSDLREGMRTAITCVVTAGDKPYTIEWTKDGMPLRDGVLDAAIHYPENGFVSTLSIEKLAYRHNGQYACSATNDVATGSYSSILTVKVPARWILKPRNSSVIAGHPARIDCQAEGVPQPHVRWKKSQGESAQNSKTIVSSSNMHVLVNGSLNFQKVQYSDSGIYICEASNGIGASLHQPIYISVHSAPQITSSFSSLTARRGQRAEISCRSRGDPPLSFTWTKNGQSLDTESSDSRYSTEVEESQDGSITVARLTIAKADRQDNVHFTCIISNAYGRDSGSVQLIVQDTPDAPQNLEIYEVSSRSVRLSWKQPFDGNSPITQYAVAWRRINDQASDNTLAVPGRETNYIVRGLRPATRYFFRVKCDNALGTSQYSAEVAATTLQEPPVAAPILLKCEPLSTHSILVSWKDSPNQLQDSVEGYYVGYKKRNDADPYTLLPVVAAEKPSLQSTILVNLLRSTEYVIVVRAFNNRGAGPPSQEFHVTTLDFNRPDIPTLKIQSVTYNSIKVSWELEEHEEAPVTGYVIFYRTGDGVWQENSISSDRSSYTLQALRCGTTYYIYGVTYNSAGRSNSSEILNARTFGNPPIAPDKRFFIDVNSTFLTVHLNVWKSNGCPITSFTLWYRKSQEDTHADYTLVEETKTSGIVTLSSLTPGTWYKLKVAATNDAGITKADYDFATMTLDGEYPPIPTEMRVNDGGLSNAHLKVTFPLVSLGLILLAVALSAACVLTRRRFLTRRPSNPDGAESSGVAKQEQLPLSVTYDGNREPNFIGTAFSTADIYQQNYLNRERTDSRQWSNKMDVEATEDTATSILQQQRQDLTYSTTYRSIDNYSPTFQKAADYCPIYHHRDMVCVKQEAVYEVPDRGRQWRRSRNEGVRNDISCSDRRQSAWKPTEGSREDCRESETECDRLWKAFAEKQFENHNRWSESHATSS